MELLRLSKFKLQLRALITETRELRERERSATEQVHLLIQKRKQSEEEFSTKLQELQVELSSSLESRLKLETRVKYLESENILLENKQKELKGTIDNLLQSRQSFLSRYEDSTCEMRHLIQTRDQKIAVMSEKIHSHLSLFDSIEKEAVFVKQVVDNVQQVVNEQENLVAALRRKTDQVSAFEKELFGKITFVENKLRCNQDEIQRKNKVISELQGQLDAARISYDCQPKIEEMFRASYFVFNYYYLQKALSMKEEVTENVIAARQALKFEAWSMESILGTIQNAVMSMNGEDQNTFSLLLEDKRSEKEPKRN